MKTNLIFAYPDLYHSLYEKFKSGGTIREWVNEVESMANAPRILHRDRDKFKGDMLEVFSEIFFTLSAFDSRNGIRDYMPVSIENDYGIDAIGLNPNNHRSVIQVKYRHNPSELIPYADIARTFTSAICQMHYNDVAEHPHTVYLFTTSGGVTGAFQQVMGDKAVIINRGVISSAVDNNIGFWETAHNMICQKIIENIP